MLLIDKSMLAMLISKNTIYKEVLELSNSKDIWKNKVLTYSRWLKHSKEISIGNMLQPICSSTDIVIVDIYKEFMNKDV